MPLRLAGERLRRADEAAGNDLPGRQGSGEERILGGEERHVLTGEQVAIGKEGDALPHRLAGRGGILDGQTAQGAAVRQYQQRVGAEGTALHAVRQDLRRRVRPDDAGSVCAGALDNGVWAAQLDLLAVFSGRQADEGGRIVRRQAVNGPLQGVFAGTDVNGQHE